jgi:hypothetical protein
VLSERHIGMYRCVCVIELATLSFLPFLEAARELNRAQRAVCVPVALSQLEARESCVVAATLDTMSTTLKQRALRVDARPTAEQQRHCCCVAL